MFVAIRADGNSDIGMGHIMRCCSIAERLVGKGHKVCFIISKDSDDEILRNFGYDFVRLRNEAPLGWDANEVREWLKKNKADRLLIDSYRVDEESLSLLSSAIDCCYIDDLNAFDYPVRTIINPNLETDMDTYHGNTKAGNYFSGLRYFPVRKSILQYKKGTLRKEVHNVLVTTGATDPLQIEKILAVNMPNQFQGMNFRFLVGKYFDSSYREVLEKISTSLDQVFLQEWTDDVGKLYEQNDIVIGPGSSSLMEALTVGTPCISYSFVDNHLDECRYLDQKKMAPYCGDFRDGADEAVTSIQKIIRTMSDYSVRNECFTAFSKVFDGKGAERVAELILNKNEAIFDETDTHQVVFGVRASAILYNFLLSNNIKGSVLLPANICELVPSTYMKAGMKVKFCDIDLKDFMPSEEQIVSILNDDQDISVLHYNRTYGNSEDKSGFFQRLIDRFTNLIIVDDSCLSIPENQKIDSNVALKLYSTGFRKPICVGNYAFSFLRNDFHYAPHALSGDVDQAYDEFDKTIKYCHKYHSKANMDVMLGNWMDPAVMPDDGYQERVEEAYDRIKSHKMKLNSIYSALPEALPEKYQNWRFNILVSNQDECLKAIFDAGLFASKHYMSLGNGYFSEIKTPNADYLEAHVINLFNDECYTEEMAEKTVDILQKVAKGIEE